MFRQREPPKRCIRKGRRQAKPEASKGSKQQAKARPRPKANAKPLEARNRVAKTIPTERTATTSAPELRDNDSISVFTRGGPRRPTHTVRHARMSVAFLPAESP